MDNICHECGMITKTATEYHPYAACVLFKKVGVSDEVRTHLRQILEYGMKGEKRGLSLDVVASDIAKMA